MTILANLSLPNIGGTLKRLTMGANDDDGSHYERGL